MKEIRKSLTELVLFIDDETIQKALRSFILKRYPQYRRGYTYKYPRIESHLFTAKISFDQEKDHD